MKVNPWAPSLIAIAAGVIWATAFTRLIPAKEDDRSPLMMPASITTCSGAAVIANIREVPEASGLAASRTVPGVMWTHNDSGRPMVFGYSSEGRLYARARITGAEVDDWEDIAVGPCPQGSCLYVGDIGDNEESRRRIAIYRVPEPAAGESETPPAEIFHAVYPDGPRDAESLFSDAQGRLYIVTKGEGSPIALYRFPEQAVPGTTATLERVVVLNDPVRRTQRITDADMSWDGKWVAMRTIRSVEFFRADDLLSGRPTPPIEGDLTPLREPQGEGVAFAKNGILYLASEGLDAAFNGGLMARVSCKLPD